MGDYCQKMMSSSSSSTTTSSHPVSGAGLGFIVTRPTSLDAVAMDYYTRINSGLVFNQHGTIVGKLKNATASTSIAAVTANPADLSAPPSLQAQLIQAGLPSFNDTVSGVLTALDNALMGNATSNSTGDFENQVGTEDDTASSQTVSRRSPHLAKQFTFGHFPEGVDTYVCNYFVCNHSVLLSLVTNPPR